MASHKSALKKQRQDKVRRSRNRAHRSNLRTQIKKMRGLITAGNAEEAKKALPQAERVLDHGATLGAIHPNAAARTKSRLARQVASLGRS